ncbi:XrtA/PEP-CTERM system histidine kinase PrsK [Crenothrix polyspora]|uniref:histidine kinase n=1 Tax=Crenothrix polyspora TaxID=360316 RepID=A0A1R4HE00_9GAMM|nr:XrtA/PEP-CTERM system histidine kinase PrsK [Crenothrix polyspora]SJM94437.1 putative Multi-sensor signal transduction histidine kinase [Crenothrix polyspora]
MNFTEKFGFFSYLIAAITYALLLFLSLKKIKNNHYAIPFTCAIAISLLWSLYTAFAIQSERYFISGTLSIETLRDTAWLFLLTTLISRQYSESRYFLLGKYKSSILLVVWIIFIFCLEFFNDFRYQFQEFLGRDIRLLAHVIFAILGLILVEQLYRNASVDLRWAIKFLCMGLGGLFFVDFIVYTKSLLFFRLDSQLWYSRGLINALVAPLLALSILRLQSEKPRISFSRKLVFHTTVLFGSGIYLVIMSLAGFYIRDYGGNWGEIGQIVFIFLGVLAFLIFSLSGKIRAITKVFLNKHFFHYRYDYRDEWIKLSKTISQLCSIDELSGFIIRTMADLVDSSGGGLWLKNDQGDFYLAEEHHLGFNAPPLISADSSLIKFIKAKRWVIDFFELLHKPEVYKEVDLLEWNAEKNNVWLLIPLFRQNEIAAFVVLTKPRVARKLNWEDHDLLKTVGMQLTNALALNRTSDELARSRQFEAYNRLSAYLVHDLKNLVAQIALIVKNSEKHKHNPEFIDDSIETLQNVVNKIDFLLSQLRQGEIKETSKSLINLVEIISDVAIQQAGNKPTLQLVAHKNRVHVVGEKEKMTAILGHLVQNAQDATQDDGFVKMELSTDNEHAIIKVIDNGTGMNSKFIAERLFKPFDTTKGNAGMGIGVYEARDYILKHAGQITVDSEVGKGTSFTIKLPLSAS